MEVGVRPCGLLSRLCFSRTARPFVTLQLLGAPLPIGSSRMTTSLSLHWARHTASVSMRMGPTPRFSEEVRVPADNLGLAGLEWLTYNSIHNLGGPFRCYGLVVRHSIQSRYNQRINRRIRGGSSCGGGDPSVYWQSGSDDRSWCNSDSAVCRRLDCVQMAHPTYMAPMMPITNSTTGTKDSSIISYTCYSQSPTYK